MTSRAIARTALCVTALLFWGSALPAQEAPPIDASYYPDLDFFILGTEERQQFVSIAEGELCPCPGEPRTLSACLASTEGRCALAEEVASLMMRLLLEGAEPDAVRDGIVLYITESTTTREFDLTNAPRRGAADAAVQIVLFSDFDCPHCHRFANTVDMLMEEFGDRVSVTYMHFPLPQHANSPLLARAAIAAHQQGRFWDMHDLLFSTQERRWDVEEIDVFLFELAEELDLDLEAFARDYANEELARRPLDDREEGRSAGVNSTPTLFINGLKFREDETYTYLRSHIRALTAE
jgi:protein-disulfide isomerase